MIGRKLLLADDSVTIQKVIDLTFSDEGMEVVTVGDGDQAVRKLEEFTPDIVLADVLMPGLDGYQLCEFIKHSDRRIPVMLLVGSFEPFDEAEARRVGADDFLTKPFQSIKQLVSRVGSLLGGKPAEPSTNGTHSTLGLGLSQSEIKVPSVTAIEPLPAETSEQHCEEDIELQTADTQELEPTPTGQSLTHSDPIETNPVNTSTQTTTAAKDFDVLLDLDDFDGDGVPEFDDAILDLDYEAPATAPAASPVQAPAVTVAASTAVVDVEQSAPLFELEAPQASSDWAIVGSPAVAAEESAAVSEPDTRTEIASLARESATTELSAEAIEAIAQRVIEKLSDKVIREIAWEVVPELAELLIKQRMDEQKS